ncbi:ComEA family DNA-binding protein [Frischella perrara]|uniref:ComEA family DNA-binding protein n=1 Tax=Frischella perrara TaxID=1267021 RepID=UPI0023F3136D|nr:ComEA family DNA-binding protein [Frischella perrara]
MKKLSKYFIVVTLIFLTTNFSLNAFAESVNHGDTSNNQIEQNATVNINTASVEELARNLNGIGLNKAKKIVEYRDQFGPFVTIEQLKDVSGIGQSILDKNVGKISLQ